MLVIVGIEYLIEFIPIPKIRICDPYPLFGKTWIGTSCVVVVDLIYCE